MTLFVVLAEQRQNTWNDNNKELPVLSFVIGELGRIINFFDLWTICRHLFRRGRNESIAWSARLIVQFLIRSLLELVSDEESKSARPLESASLPLRVQEMEEQRKKDEKEGKSREDAWAG